MKFNLLIKSVPSAVACAVASAIIAASLLIAPSWAQDQPSAQAPPPPPSQAKPPTAPLTPEQLHELVAPIALYPDASGGADSCRLRLSDANRRGGTIPATKSKSQRQGLG